eukprot:4603454-Pyramimonas_sp.AAC.1
MCAALKREPHFENHPPSICETVSTCLMFRVISGEEVLSETALKTGLGVRQGEIIYKEKNGGRGGGTVQTQDSSTMLE